MQRRGSSSSAAACPISGGLREKAATGATARPRAAFSLGLLLIALPLLAHCGLTPARRATPLPPPAPPTSATAAARDAVLPLSPDAELQALIDPYPAPSGPSWLGGDVASSIRLADDRYVWIFGDTLLGVLHGDCAVRGGACRREIAGPGAGMIANSVGTMVRSRDGSFYPIVKYWRSEGDASAPIFATSEEGFLWPLAGVRVGTVLLIAANRHTFESGLLPVGNHLIRVYNPDAPPDIWLYDVQPLPGFVAPAPDGGPLVSWTTALVHVGRHVYLFGSRDVGEKAETVVARVAVDDLAERGWRPAPEFLVRAADGGAPLWSTDLPAASALHVVPGLPGTSEAAIAHDAALGWYTFQIPALSYDIRLYTADDLLGPWTDRGVVYAIPAPWSTTTRGPCPPLPPGTTLEEIPPACEHVYAAYAPKTHPELAPPDGYVVTYNVNVWSGGYDAAVRALEEQPAFYVPQMLATPDAR
ncbi:MAG TPA: hypothetical protein VIS07_21930 [Candidatus Binatia bacterium]